MIQIDYKQTERNAKYFLECLTKNFIETGCCSVKKVDLFDIDDDTDIKSLVQLNVESKYNDLILNALNCISKMSLENKKMLYCAHLLEIKRKSLRSDYEPYEYSFGNPFYTYEKALREFGLLNSILVELYESKN